VGGPYTIRRAVIWPDVRVVPLTRTSGTGRMGHLKDVNRRFKNGFREGQSATKKAKTESA
jgi:hypothetical protein